MQYKIELLDADSSGSIGTGHLQFGEVPLIPSVGDYLPINGDSYTVARRDFLFGKDQCTVCLQLRASSSTRSTHR